MKKTPETPNKSSQELLVNKTPEALQEGSTQTPCEDTVDSVKAKSNEVIYESREYPEYLESGISHYKIGNQDIQINEYNDYHNPLSDLEGKDLLTEKDTVIKLLFASIDPLSESDFTESVEEGRDIRLSQCQYIKTIIDLLNFITPDDITTHASQVFQDCLLNSEEDLDISDLLALGYFRKEFLSYSYMNEQESEKITSQILKNINIDDLVSYQDEVLYDGYANVAITQDSKFQYSKFSDQYGLYIFNYLIELFGLDCDNDFLNKFLEKTIDNIPTAILYRELYDIKVDTIDSIVRNKIFSYTSFNDCTDYLANYNAELTDSRYSLWEAKDIFIIKLGKLIDSSRYNHSTSLRKNVSELREDHLEIEKIVSELNNMLQNEEITTEESVFLDKFINDFESISIIIKSKLDQNKKNSETFKKHIENTKIKTKEAKVIAEKKEKEKNLSRKKAQESVVKLFNIQHMDLQDSAQRLYINTIKSGLFHNKIEGNKKDFIILLIKKMRKTDLSEIQNEKINSLIQNIENNELSLDDYMLLGQLIVKIYC